MTLYIDTSSEETKIAIFIDGEVLAEKEWLSDKNQSEELLSEIDNLFKSIKKDKAALENIVVVTGPGSYTGLRVGLSTANALALSLNIKIVGIGAGLNPNKIIKGLKPNNSKFTAGVMPNYLYPPKITIKKAGR